MSASLLRGLRILEMIRNEPLGVSEVARRIGVDKAGVSRVLRSLIEEGWVERMGRLHVLGPRALLLTADARTTPLLHRAGATVRRLREETGHAAVVMQLRPQGPLPLAIEWSETTPEVQEEAFEHLWATAGGLALLAQLPEEDLDDHLDVDPWPSRAGGPASVDEVHALLSQARSGVPLVERSWNVQGLGCVAVPWRSGHEDDAVPAPTAVTLLGPETDILRDHDRLVELLRAVGEDVA
ncbi:IclR family transcriptional regulator [Nocardioides solisilvae]|uniref:IclR family transcriptional regulator n=1 Tax=Nocardioides solisilvae TaxID=1542435 RepID=UPI000D74DF67|nr:helix-turn-helix domain-containing protein [Nocardioides solisilvae]